MLRSEGRTQIRLPQYDGVTLARQANVADDDIATACDARACGISQRDVYVAGLVIRKRLLAGGRVAATREVRIERQVSNRYVDVASVVVNERRGADGSVSEADGIANERIVTQGWV